MSRTVKEEEAMRKLMNDIIDQVNSLESKYWDGDLCPAPDWEELKENLDDLSDVVDF